MAEKQIFAFVLIPFDPTFDGVYKLAIKEAAKQVGIIAERNGPKSSETLPGA